MIALTIIALLTGLASTGALLLAIVTDYWLYTSEPLDFENMILGGEVDVSAEDFPPDALEGFQVDDNYPTLNESTQIILPAAISLHSGLWRVCVFFDEPGLCALPGLSSFSTTLNH